MPRGHLDHLFSVRSSFRSVSRSAFRNYVCLFGKPILFDFFRIWLDGKKA